MELIPLLCCLSLCIGCTSAQEIRTVNVPEGDDAFLPCILNSGQSISRFDWRKDNGDKEKKEVFRYESGSYFGKDLDGQDKQFTDRVVFFQHELKSGNASIIIRNTRLEDSGTYTCGLVELHRPVHIRLNVGAARVPYVKTMRDEITWSLLECKVKGVPEPEVEWRNSAGQVLVKHNPDNPDVELQVTVDRSDNYTCVATQREIYHQINNTLQVSIPVVVAVVEGKDAVLPCFLDSKQNIKSMKFSWIKDDKEAYLYDADQVKENKPFKGRLTHFQHELKSGNASIKIHNTQMSDSGRYSCELPNFQKSHVLLQVVEHPSGSVGGTANVPTLILAAILGVMFEVL